jgi:hypothetical protein
MKWVTKEVPAEYCKPVCETRNVDHPYEVEHWQKQELDCGELHCKTCEPKTEQIACKTCKTEPGKTTVKVHYWSCVKVPYTVYRQVEREVCVKQPRYEKVEIPVTRYVCQNCGGRGCGQCCRHEEDSVPANAAEPGLSGPGPGPGAEPVGFPQAPIPMATASGPSGN